MTEEMQRESHILMPTYAGNIQLAVNLALRAFANGNLIDGFECTEVIYMAVPEIREDVDKKIRNEIAQALVRSSDVSAQDINVQRTLKTNKTNNMKKAYAKQYFSEVMQILKEHNYLEIPGVKPIYGKKGKL